jgi:hypothetical protein
MKKLLVLTVLMLLVNGQSVFAEDRSIENAVQPSTTDINMTTVRVQEKDSRLVKSGFYIEPLLSVSQEDTSIKSSQLPFIHDDSSGNSKGFGVGLRIGAHVSDTLLLGIDTRYSRMQTDDSFYNKADADVYNIAPMIGLQTPFYGIRLLASYVVAGENNPASGAQGVDLKYKEALGWRLGAGLYVASVSVNLEYQDLTYNTTEVESFGSVAVNKATSVDANSRGYTVSLSFPIEL